MACIISINVKNCRSLYIKAANVLVLSNSVLCSYNRTCAVELMFVLLTHVSTNHIEVPAAASQSQPSSDVRLLSGSTTFHWANVSINIWLSAHFQLVTVKTECVLWLRVCDIKNCRLVVTAAIWKHAAGYRMHSHLWLLQYLLMGALGLLFCSTFVISLISASWSSFLVNK